MNTTVASSGFKASLLDFLSEWQPLLAFVAPCLVLLSVLIAWLAIKRNQDVNRRRATIDLIEKSESSEHYRKILKTFKDSFSDHQTPEQLAQLTSPVSDGEKQARREVQHYLNHYELVAIGVLGKSLHEKTYRSWMMTVLIRDWNWAADYIQRDRWKYDADAAEWIYNKRLYAAFERLARKWGAKCGLKVRQLSKHSSPPPVERGTVDQAVPRLDPDDGTEATAANNLPKSAKPKKPSRQLPPKQPESR